MDMSSAEFGPTAKKAGRPPKKLPASHQESAWRFCTQSPNEQRMYDEMAEWVPPRRKLKRRQISKLPLEKGSKVTDIGDPTRIGTVRIKGPEVSEVVWSENCVRFVSNDKLVVAGRDQ